MEYYVTIIHISFLVFIFFTHINFSKLIVFITVSVYSPMNTRGTYYSVITGIV